MFQLSALHWIITDTLVVTMVWLGTISFASSIREWTRIYFSSWRFHLPPVFRIWMRRAFLIVVYDCLRLVRATQDRSISTHVFYKIDCNSKPEDVTCFDMKFWYQVRTKIGQLFFCHTIWTVYKFVIVHNIVDTFSCYSSKYSCGSWRNV